MSSFVRKMSVSELRRTAWRSITRVEPPGPAAAPGVGAVLVAALDRGRRRRRRTSSVGNGPDPTRVMYAFVIPMMRSMCRGPTPAPAHAPPATGFDDVTNGYVPWSRSRNVACAPSNITCWPASRASWTRFTESTMRRLEPGGDLAEVQVADVVGRRRQAVVDLGQDRVLLLEHHLELLPEDLGVEEVLHPQADPGGLVGVGGADAALRGAQLVLAQVALEDDVELLVVRQDQVGVAGHDQVGRVDAARPRARSSSPSRMRGSTTTPLPMTFLTPGCRIPLGTSRTAKPARRRRSCGRRCGRPGSGRPCPSRPPGCR